MKLFPLHPWNVSPQEAVKIQKELAARVRAFPLEGKVRLVAGCDISFNHPRTGKDSGTGYAAVAVFEVTEEGLAPVEEVTAEGPLSFPYVPGLLGFREIPVLAAAFKKLRRAPGLILCDGQGAAHPRRFGIASHLGLLLDAPTVGCAKSVLCGQYESPPKERGGCSSLCHEGEEIGKMLRTREGVAPVVVSVGHRVTLDEACAWVLRLARRYRLPEPTRRAHALSNEARKLQSV
ncbi:MAG: endonuclease V [Acidobacteriota bacterium]|nr:MAG: endonuclease V [Acidobacteriota bacterium]